MISKNDGVISGSMVSPAWIMDALMFWALHWQHGLDGLAFLIFLAKQAGFSHTNSHLGLAQRAGFLHFQSHLVSSHIGVQLALGAVQAVLHLAGAHTVSHLLGQPAFSHISLGHLTLH